MLGYSCHQHRSQRIEFIQDEAKYDCWTGSLVKVTLLDGKMADIVVIHEVYNVILSANNVKNSNCNRKKWNNSYKLKCQGWNSTNQSVWIKLVILKWTRIPEGCCLASITRLSGADNTGSFSDTGKIMAFWKNFLDAKDDGNEISALACLGTTTNTQWWHVCWSWRVSLQGLPDGHQHCPNGKVEMVDVYEKQDQSERLPPTRDALHQAILQAH